MYLFMFKVTVFFIHYNLKKMELLKLWFSTVFTEPWLIYSPPSPYSKIFCLSSFFPINLVLYHKYRVWDIVFYLAKILNAPLLPLDAPQKYLRPRCLPLSSIHSTSFNFSRYSNLQSNHRSLKFFDDVYDL